LPIRTGRAPRSLQVAEELLGQPPLPAQPVHDLELLGAGGGAALDEPPEPVGLGGEAELGQRRSANTQSRTQLAR
jgi:hypothetical protein